MGGTQWRVGPSNGPRWSVLLGVMPEMSAAQDGEHYIGDLRQVRDGDVLIR